MYLKTRCINISLKTWDSLVLVVVVVVVVVEVVQLCCGITEVVSATKQNPETNWVDVVIQSFTHIGWVK